MEKPLSLEELKELRKPVIDINKLRNDQLKPLEKLALFITEHVGTMGFFFIIFTWTVIWLGWNIFAPNQYRFDPSPAFVLWLFISNMIQIFLMPLLLIGQNLQSKHAEIRAKADYDTNQKAEREVETIINHLENQNEILSKIWNKLESKS